MAEELEDSGLLGPKEWVTIIAIVIAVYLYRAFHHILPSSIGSPANTSAAAQAGLDDEIRRRNIQEARRKLIEESERKIDENRDKIKVAYIMVKETFCDSVAFGFRMGSAEDARSRSRQRIRSASFSFRKKRNRSDANKSNAQRSSSMLAKNRAVVAVQARSERITIR